MAFAPFIKNAKIKINGVQYEDEVSNVTFTPTTSTNAFNPISGKAVNDSQVTGWTCAFTYGSDINTPTTLASALHDMAIDGAAPVTDVAVEFQPLGGGPTNRRVIKSTLRSVMPGAIGGAAGVATSTSTSPCTRPTFAAAT